MLALLIAAKIGFNAAALMSAGLALHAALGVIVPARTKTILAAAAVSALILILMAGVRLALLNAQLGDGLADAFSIDLTAWSWQSLGPATLLALTGAGLIVIAAVSRWRIVAGIGALAVASSFPLTGHVSGTDNAVWLQGLLGLHVLIAAFWVAAPLTLWPARHVGDAALASRLRLFSNFATAAIPVLLVAGLLIALVLAGGVSGLISTAYGWLLLLKLGATLVALGAGAINRQVITTHMAINASTARRWLGFTLTIETTVFAAVIIIVSLATTAWPPAHA